MSHLGKEEHSFLKQEGVMVRREMRKQGQKEPLRRSKESRAGKKSVLAQPKVGHKTLEALNTYQVL